ncbi:MAG: purine-binding chemotaxis protein CheW [Acidobacteria bacterium]|nr:MAG: purine-binding chemotaxis protein CheW [Acidobacteriota bacterium]
MNERSDQPENGTGELPQSGLKDEILQRDENDRPGLLYRFADSLRGGDEEQEKPEEPEIWLVFRLGGTSFGLPVADIREVMRVGPITRVPEAPFSVTGVTDLRGRVIPIVDLGARLELDAVEVDEQSRIVVLDADGRLIGLLVDAVDRMARILPSQKEDPEPDADERTAAVVAVYAWEEEKLMLLDVEELLTIDETHPGH